MFLSFSAWFLTGEYTLRKNCRVWLTGGRPSGREVKERRGKLELTLKDEFEVREGSEVSVQSVLAYLGLDDDSQKLVSRVVKEIFPGIEMRREDKKGIKQYPFNTCSLPNMQ